MEYSSKKISKIVLIAVVVSCLYAVSSVHAVGLPNDPSGDPHTIVAFAQQNIIIDGTVQTKPITGFPPDFKIAMDYGTNDRATGVTTYANAPFPSVTVSSQGYVYPGQVAVGNGLRTTDTLPQNRITLSGTLSGSTNYLAGPNGTMLQDVTVTCRGGSVVTTQPAVAINGKVTVGMPVGENDCKVAYNFDGANTSGGNWVGGSTVISVTPSTQTVVAGQPAKFLVSAVGASPMYLNTGYLDNWGGDATNNIIYTCYAVGYGCGFTPGDRFDSNTATDFGGPATLNVNTGTPGTYSIRVNAMSEANWWLQSVGSGSQYPNVPNGVGDAYGGNGTTYASQYVQIIVTEPPVTLSVHTPNISADPVGAHGGSVFQNGRYQIKWNTGGANPDGCSVSGAWSGTRAPGGGIEDRSIDTSTIGVKRYTITCFKTNFENVTDTLYVDVKPAPSKCDINASGTNKLVGCVWSWDTAAANAAGVTFGSAPDVGSQFWSLSSQAPDGNTMTVPVADTASAIDQDWGAGGPAGLTDKFLVVWKGSFNFKSSGYTFTGGSDDGQAVYVDNKKVVDDWSDHTYRTLTSASQTLSAGNHPVQLVYYDGGSNARTSLSWANASALVPDDSQCISVTPSSYSVPAGSNFTATVMVRNTGSASWTTPQYTLSNTSYKTLPHYFAPPDASLPSSPIASGAPATFTLNLTATTIPGSYPFSWQMIHQGVAWFGPICSSPTNITVTAALRPAITFTASPTTGPSPMSTGLSWSVANNPTSCTASSNPSSSFWNGPTSSFGFANTSGITVPTTYTLSCSNANGSSSASVTVTPTAATYSVNVTKTTGGSVKSVDGLINCGATCANTYTQNSTVTLKAYPDSSLWQFIGWAGACSGTGDCTLLVNGSKTVSALFQRRPLIYQEF